jgi:hypothetical protein
MRADSHDDGGCRTSDEVGAIGPGRLWAAGTSREVEARPPVKRTSMVARAFFPDLHRR